MAKLNTESTGNQEISTLQPPLHRHNFKWKSKPIWLICLFNFSMVCILAALIISETHNKEAWKKIVVWCLGGVLSVCFVLLIWPMHKLLKEYKDHDGIIKPTRLKYFRAGTSCSFISSLFTLLSICVGLVLSGTEVKIVACIFIAICILLGMTSAAFISIYGFCSSFDIYYHKNKVELVKDYLIRSGISDKEIKMDDGDQIDES